MENKRLLKSIGGGSVLARSSGTGSVGGSASDRAPSESRKQGNGILESAAHAELRLDLNGEAEHGVNGFNASTDDRILHVPYTKTADAAVAILLCRQGGILREKLAAMDGATAAFTYATTFPRSVMEN